MRIGHPTLWRICGLLCTSLLLAFVQAPTVIYAAGATRFVSPGGVDDFFSLCLAHDHPCATFGFALKVAFPGDTIRGAEGDYGWEKLVIKKDISIIGAGKGLTRINGGGGLRVVFVQKGVTVTLAQLSLLNGLGLNGGERSRTRAP